MKLNFLALLCMAVLCTILALGLWPFHSPANEVSWLQTHNGLHFGKYGTVFSSRPFPSTNPRNSQEATVEIWLHPRRIWDSGTFLAFYSPGNLFQFSLRQSQTDLLLRTQTPDDTHHPKTANLYVEEVFRKTQPVFLTVTSGKAACIYADGVLVATNPHFPLSAREFSGRLIVGDSPGQNDSWSGQLLGLAIYNRQLTANEVFHHYAAWIQNGRPELIDEEHNIALYVFDEHTGSVVRNKVPSGVDLNIPERYQVLDKIALEPFWTEFSMSRSYWGAAIKNIVGFLPFGFCFYPYMAIQLPNKRPALLTVVLGTTVSLTIEVLQAFLPTRESGTSDLITNTIGTWMGVASYRFLSPILVRSFPWLPFPAPRE